MAHTQSRADDERLLTVLALRDLGLLSPQIAELVGMADRSVRKALKALDRDMREAS